MLGKWYDLKIQSPSYEAVKLGAKTFDCRYNEHNFQTGDKICLHHWDAEKEQYITESEPIWREITYVLTTDGTNSVGLREGWCIFGMKKYTPTALERALANEIVKNNLRNCQAQ